MEKELTSLMFKLHEYGITGIQILYEGGGDQGCIEKIAFTQENVKEPYELSEVIEDPWDRSYKLDKIIPGIDSSIIQNLESDIDDLVTELLLNDIEDWWNNDGGFGTVNMLVPSGEYEIENNVRRIETDCYTHEDKIFNKLKN